MLFLAAKDPIFFFETRSGKKNKKKIHEQMFIPRPCFFDSSAAQLEKDSGLVVGRRLAHCTQLTSNGCKLAVSTEDVLQERGSPTFHP